MSRMLLTLFLLPLLLTSRVGAQVVESSFLLILPVRAQGTQALATLETVVVDMGGYLQREKGSPTIVDAAWDAATRVRGTLIQEHSVILTLLVGAADTARIPARTCRYTWRSEAPTSHCCWPRTTRLQSA